MNLGTISASKLHLGVPRREAVPLMFRLLRETTLPGLRHLIITLGMLWKRHFGRVTFDPMSCFEEADAGLAQTWKLDPSVADRLDSILIDLEAVHFVNRAREFFQLFGAANSPEVLRVLIRDRPRYVPLSRNIYKLELICISQNLLVKEL
jgi:hypothetical protein